MLVTHLSKKEDDWYAFVQFPELADHIIEITRIVNGCKKVQMPAGAATTSVRCLVWSTRHRGFYRAICLSAREEKVAVRYMDYGDSECVSRKDLYLLANDLADIPPLCYPVRIQTGKSPPKPTFDDRMKTGNLMKILYVKACASPFGDTCECAFN